MPRAARRRGTRTKSDVGGSSAEEAIAAVTMTPEEEQDAARLRTEFGEPRLRLIRREDAEKETRRTGLFGEYLYRGLDTTCNAATGDGKTTLFLAIARAIATKTIEQLAEDFQRMMERESASDPVEIALQKLAAMVPLAREVRRQILAERKAKRDARKAAKKE